MARKRKQILRQTTVTAFLGLNIQVEQNGQVQLFTMFLFPLTTWLLIWWRGQAALDQGAEIVQTCLTGFYEQLLVWTLILTVGCKSILYGAGVAL